MSLKESALERRAEPTRPGAGGAADVSASVPAVIMSPERGREGCFLICNMGTVALAPASPPLTLITGT